MIHIDDEKKKRLKGGFCVNCGTDVSAIGYYYCGGENCRYEEKENENE